MTEPKPDELFEAYLLGATPVSRVYREGAQDQPPPALDTAIVDAARRGAPARRRRFRQPLPAHWLVPLSTAAVVVLSVTLVWTLQRRELAPVPAPSGAPAPEARVAAPPAKSALRAERKADAPEEAIGSVGKMPAPAPLPDLAQSQALAKKEAAPAPAAPMREMERAAAARPAAPADGVRAESKYRAARAMAPAPAAQVISVAVSGAPGAYQFAVGIRSPDTGCDRYADWWEVLSEDGKLLYRRILDHSHVDEQPFVRAGGPVPIQRDTVVWVRAHLHPQGYGGDAFTGSVRAGFRRAALSPTFAVGAASQPPLPQGCAF